MLYRFEVKCTPPKKDGANSMWNKPVEAKRLVALRTAAQNAIKGNPPLQSKIKLNLTVHVGMKNDKTTGDLDNFITGVFDGLMKRDPRSKLHEKIWSNPEYRDVHPDKVIAIVDDSQVIQIQAEKIVGDSEQPWYEVILEGE